MRRSGGLTLLALSAVAVSCVLLASSCTGGGDEDVSVGGTATAPPSDRQAAGATATAERSPSTEPAGTAETTTPKVPETTHPAPSDTDPAPVPSDPPPPGQPIDCGYFNLAVGWPTTFVPPPDIPPCFVSAFEAGTPATASYAEQTDGNGGSFVTTDYEVIGVRRARVTINATEAIGRPQIITVLECGSVVERYFRLAHDDCTPVG